MNTESPVNQLGYNNMNTESPTIQLGYHTKSFGWVQPNIGNNKKVGILNTTLHQNKYKNLDTNVILLRQPQVNALEVDYNLQINYTGGSAGIVVFNPLNWRFIHWLRENRPFDELTYHAQLDTELWAASNVPGRIQYGYESFPTRRKVTVKLKKINFDSLVFPSGLPVLQEFVEYIKNGNKRDYDEGNFISVLNDAVIDERTAPPIEATILFGDNIIEHKMYSRQLTHIEKNEDAVLIGSIAKSLLSFALSKYEPAKMAADIVTTIGPIINDIINPGDINQLFGNEKIPNGYITEYSVAKTDGYILVTNLDYITLYKGGYDITATKDTRLAEETVTSDAYTYEDSPNCLLDTGVANIYTKIRANITKKLKKNVMLETTSLYRKNLFDLFAEGLGYNGFILAGSYLYPGGISFESCNYVSYTHINAHPREDRLYCQYKFNLNLNDILSQFSQPGETGDWSDGPGFNSIWIDDMPFGFFVKTDSDEGEWYYTRYATDLPYTYVPPE